jgi:5'(3')-deoxyribonucleotidase
MDKTGKPGIVLDIDEILADTLTQLIEWHNINYNTSLNWNDCYTYKMWNIWDCTKEENMVRINRFFNSEYAEKILPVKGSQLGVMKLALDYDIHLVTGRDTKSIIDTNKWLLQYFPQTFLPLEEFTGHYYNNKPLLKSEVCKKLNAKIIIEDDLEHAIDCLNNGLTVILMDKPWNKGYDHENLYREDSWDKIARTAEELKRELYHKKDKY